jgi:hypothetical protein
MAQCQGKNMQLGKDVTTGRGHVLLPFACLSLALAFSVYPLFLHTHTQTHTPAHTLACDTLPQCPGEPSTRNHEVLKMEEGLGREKGEDGERAMGGGSKSQRAAPIPKRKKCPAPGDFIFLQTPWQAC